MTALTDGKFTMELPSAEHNEEVYVEWQRISGRLIDGANEYLKACGFARSYIPSEYMGLYEHYGYRYLKDIVNYGGGTDHLFVKEFE